MFTILTNKFFFAIFTKTRGVTVFQNCNPDSNVSVTMSPQYM